MKEWYVDVVCNGFQVLEGLGFVEYGANCEVFRAMTTHVLGFALWHIQHTGQLNKDIKQLLCAKHELPKSSHLQSLTQQLKRKVATTIKCDVEAFYLDGHPSLVAHA